ncbi:MAG: class A beta-lactamase-related serine hydrolase [Prevotellaceae bacterium]|nr:class A beta-lactamase-related serine hydrolase [Prevotellaceae bacterium]
MNKKVVSCFLYVITVVLSSCSVSGTKQTETLSANRMMMEELKDSLTGIAGEYPGEIGIALLTDRGDTVVVNDEDKYPLMSVFKLHQTISICRLFELRGTTTDSIVDIRREQLNPDTWSPMLTDYSSDSIRISVGELIRYALIQSDNNASNYLFENIESVADADRFISTLIPRETFRLAVTESDMWSNHALCYENHSSPLGAACLMNRLFTDSIIGSRNRDFICTALRECKTGTDRIVEPLTDKDGVTVAHKTGSGFRDEHGVLSAHNDVAFVALPDGRHYTLAVLVKDFNGSEKQASEAISRVSAAVYAALSETR